MNLFASTRNKVLTTLFAAVLAGVAPPQLRAADYPTKPVRVVVAFTAGGTTDILARPGFEAGSWFGFFAPKGTPQPVITLLNRTVNDVLPLLEEQLVREGADPVGGTPEEFGKFTEGEYKKWKAVVQASGAVAE